MALESVLSMSTSQALAGGAPEAAPRSSPARARRQHVFDVALVAGRPYYGYHAEERAFVRLSLYNPREVSRAALLMQSGAVLGRRWQPHEAHVPFLLQFKLDFNLYGMGWVRLSRGRFRTLPAEAHAGVDELPSQRAVGTPVGGRVADGAMASPAAAQVGVAQAGDGTVPDLITPASNLKTADVTTPLTTAPRSMTKHAGATSPATSARLWTRHASLPSDWTWDESAPPCQTTCELELDACVDAILNRDGLARVPLSEASPDTRLVESLAPMWAEEAARCGGAVPPRAPSPERDPQPLCEAIEATRAEFEAIALAQSAAAEPQALKEPVTPLSARPELQTPASQAPPPSTLLTQLATPANLVSVFETPSVRAGRARTVRGSEPASAEDRRLAKDERNLDDETAFIDTQVLAALFSQVSTRAGVRGQKDGLTNLLHTQSSSACNMQKSACVFLKTSS